MHYFIGKAFLEKHINEHNETYSVDMDISQAPEGVCFLLINLDNASTTQKIEQL
jgi:hypothetical protein